MKRLRLILTIFVCVAAVSAYSVGNPNSPDSNLGSENLTSYIPEDEQVQLYAELMFKHIIVASIDSAEALNRSVGFHRLTPTEKKYLSVVPFVGSLLLIFKGTQKAGLPLLKGLTPNKPSQERIQRQFNKYRHTYSQILPIEEENKKLKTQIADIKKDQQSKKEQPAKNSAKNNLKTDTAKAEQAVKAEQQAKIEQQRAQMRKQPVFGDENILSGRHVKRIYAEGEAPADLDKILPENSAKPKTAPSLSPYFRNQILETLENEDSPATAAQSDKTTAQNRLEKTNQMSAKLEQIKLENQIKKIEGQIEKNNQKINKLYGQLENLVKARPGTGLLYRSGRFIRSAGYTALGLGIVGASLILVGNEYFLVIEDEEQMYNLREEYLQDIALISSLLRGA